MRRPSKPAYFPLYVRDFLSDTKVLRLTWIEQGIHLRMLMVSWEGGALPDEPADVVRQIGLAEGLGTGECSAVALEKAIQRVWGLCWVKTEHGWESPRLERERERVKALGMRWQSEGGRRRAESGIRGPDGRFLSSKLDQQAGECGLSGTRIQLAGRGPAELDRAGLQLDQLKEAQAQVSSSPLLPPVGDPKKKGRGRAPVGVEIPEELQTERFKAAWAEWAAHRRHSKTSLTPEGERRALGKLRKWGEARAVAAIENSLEQGYRGLFEPSENGNGKHHEEPRSWLSPQ